MFGSFLFFYYLKSNYYRNSEFKILFFLEIYLFLINLCLLLFNLL